MSAAAGREMNRKCGKGTKVPYIKISSFVKDKQQRRDIIQIKRQQEGSTD